MLKRTEAQTSTPVQCAQEFLAMSCFSVTYFKYTYNTYNSFIGVTYLDPRPTFSTVVIKIEFT